MRMRINAQSKAFGWPAALYAPMQRYGGMQARSSGGDAAELAFAVEPG